ncbi:MAG: hypothetical protein HXM46_12355, partial [Lautropia mirabilis]|nr:hypothetical protein [Lautropia mirabilis]
MKNADRPTSSITVHVRTALCTAQDNNPGTPLCAPRRTPRQTGATRAAHLAMASLLGLGLVACGGPAASGHEPHAGTPPSATDNLRPGTPNISGNTPTTPDTTGRTPAPTAPT